LPPWVSFALPVTAGVGGGDRAILTEPMQELDKRPSHDPDFFEFIFICDLSHTS